MNLSLISGTSSFILLGFSLWNVCSQLIHTFPTPGLIRSIPFTQEVKPRDTGDDLVQSGIRKGDLCPKYYFLADIFLGDLFQSEEYSFEGPGGKNCVNVIRAPISYGLYAYPAKAAVFLCLAGLFIMVSFKGNSHFLALGTLKSIVWTRFSENINYFLGVIEDILGAVLTY